MIKVYHNPNFINKNPQDFMKAELVAEVMDDDLEVAYMLTNHIDESWWKHPNVKCIKESRSTSVGDFMVKDGEWYIVAPVGFDKIDTTVSAGYRENS